MKTISSLQTMSLTAVMILSIIMLSACTETRPAPGTYETTKTSTDANGTTSKTNNTTNIYYDKNGKMHGTVEKETTTDPKGLMNKTTTQSTTKIQ